MVYVQLSNIMIGDAAASESDVVRRHRVVGSEHYGSPGQRPVMHNESIHLTVRPSQVDFIEQQPDMFFVKQLDVVRPREPFGLCNGLCRHARQSLCLSAPFALLVVLRCQPCVCSP